ncbi:helix-turn-helix domain-containing protein [Zavarzinella formosa]|uniref:helix-turn-helix domain-containing protein n=1 Tax=Zavarzinella formosa TaxID=360055 RepID=UPI00030D3C9B|nr:helix-turn-helix transcriptional regulator [Zavarzinella formosa]
MADPLATLFGALVRRRREATGLSQEEVGERTNLSRNYIGMVERGETNPTLRVLQSLAQALGTTMVSLVRELEDSLGGG